eukprot:TRINITY_DN3523_c0_g1_i1.p1 TRINITY_DN3523_c0_g1~~TRINITY_DN3523_c0_g1_i1.p1  ORF type:complete len:368 (+),score=40.11 TRINITY_DN3523_c0_g1_i1:165-1106(+)
MKLKWSPGVIDTDVLPYCNAEGEDENMCVLWDKYQVGIPRGDKSLLIVTKVKEVVERRMCPIGATSCPVPGIWQEVNKTSRFIAGVERTQLQLEHSFVAPLFYEESGHSSDYSRDNKDMNGVFIRGHGSESVITHKFETRDPDSIPLPALLAAADVKSLDITTDIIGDNGNKTLRDSGFYLYVDIYYNNIRCDGSLSCAFGTVEPEYRYRANMVPQEVHVTKIVSENRQEGTRLRRVFYGVVINIKQSGKIGRFSLTALMFQIVGGLGMLAISTAVVDTFGPYFMSKFDEIKYDMITIETTQKVDNKSRKELH